MVSLDTFRKMASSFPDVAESIHFSLVVFGVRKKNFASFDPRSGELSLRLPLTDPDLADGLERKTLSKIPGKYGAQGWTLVDMEAIGKTEFVKLLDTAYRGVASAPKTRTRP